MGGTSGTYRRQKRCIQGSVERPEGKRPLGRPTRKWENNIKKDQVGWGALTRSPSGKGQVGGACECGNDALGSIKCRESILTENLSASHEGLCFMEP